MAVIIPQAGGSGYVLSQYIFLLRQLLHDPDSNFYTATALNNFINLARNKLARETACLRVIVQGVNISQGLDNYSVYTTLPNGPDVIDVLGISVYYGNLRIKMRYLPFTQMDANFRSLLSYQQVPTLFSKVGNTIYMSPVPNQAYTSDWDCVIQPTQMVDDTTPEQIPAPFNEAVPFYAAYWAKQYEQSFGEADRFLQQYLYQMNVAKGAFNRRQLSDPYAMG